MEPLFKHIEKRAISKPAKRDKTTERGELMRYFLGRLNPSRIQSGYKPLSMGRIGLMLEGIPTKDLYALKTKCEDAERRGFLWSKRFWWEIKPKENS